MRKAKKMVIIITLLSTLLMISVGVVKFATKTIVTAIDLAGINDSVRYYNEQRVKTDAMTDICREAMKVRREQFYESKDVWVRFFSNQNAIIKIVITLIAICMYLIVIYIWIEVIYFFVKRGIRKRLKRRRKLSLKGAR